MFRVVSSLWLGNTLCPGRCLKARDSSSAWGASRHQSPGTRGLWPYCFCGDRAELLGEDRVMHKLALSTLQGLASSFQNCSHLHACVQTHVCAGMCGAQTCLLGHPKHVHTHRIPLCSASAAVCTRTPAWTNTPVLNVFANPTMLAHPVHTHLLQPESQPARVYLASVHSQIHKYTH